MAAFVRRYREATASIRSAIPAGPLADHPAGRGGARSRRVSRVVVPSKATRHDIVMNVLRGAAVARARLRRGGRRSDEAAKAANAHTNAGRGTGGAHGTRGAAGARARARRSTPDAPFAMSAISAG